MSDRSARSDAEMTARLSMFRPMASQFKDALHTFQSAESKKFQILKTIHPSDPNNPRHPEPPSPTESPRTLLILDSSFNPPSVAHRTLVQSALHTDSISKYDGPYRLLLLFATMNADKDPSPAAFEQRITLMTIFASDLLIHLQNITKAGQHRVVAVDIGVTKVPFYTDKTLAIAAEAKQLYPRGPKHVHLIGFDTLTRFLNPKYYPSFDPPLSALDAYFDAGHHVRTTLRPDDGFGTVEDQQLYISRLENGELDPVGGKARWAKQVEIARDRDGVGVSSTKIRNAIVAGRWLEVQESCTPGVAAWLQAEKLYTA
nr:putative nicotinamide mononucleotide adenylyltransferase [Quercus suber]